MDEHLNQVAEQTGVPAALVERSAKARAAADGVAVETILAAWAGGEAPAAVASAPAPAAPAPAAPAAAPDAEGAGKVPDKLLRRSAAAKAKREGRPLNEVLAEMGLSPEPEEGEAPAAPAAPAEASAAAAAPAAEPTPAEAPPTTAAQEPAPEPEPLLAGFPRWLAASFIIIPLIALLYAGFSPNGPGCGTSGQLAINPVNGEAQSCDGGGSVFFTQGEATYTSICVACHSADGSGGVGPALAGGSVLETFSSCTDHIDWVTLGSANWPDATYGDTNKPVLGFSGSPMPGYDGTFTPEEIASVVLYERVAFGGADLATEEVACGLTEAAGG